MTSDTVQSMSASHRGYVLGLVAAFSFGISAPLSKRLLGELDSAQLLAGLLYLGAFAALAVASPFRRTGREARLRRGDLPGLAAMVASGGIAAPVLLLIGLQRLSGANASLLLNLEGPFTLLLAVAVAGEYLDRRAAIGAAAIFAGGVVLTGVDPSVSRSLTGALYVAAACLLWAVDNNLTQRLTVRDPFMIVSAKTAVAGTVNMTVAIILGAGRPPAGVIASAVVLGAVSYGLSVLADAYALRLLGAAREAAVFALAPFLGALIAVPMLHEHLGRAQLIAAVAMAGGVALMVSERHRHRHRHQRLEHDHAHVHDAHHQHAHVGDVPIDVPHAHPHDHEPLEHAHRHVSDVHHRHDH